MWNKIDANESTLDANAKLDSVKETSDMLFLLCAKKMAEILKQYHKDQEDGQRNDTFAAGKVLWTLAEDGIPDLIQP